MLEVHPLLHADQSKAGTVRLNVKAAAVILDDQLDPTIELTDRDVDARGARVMDRVA